MEDLVMSRNAEDDFDAQRMMQAALKAGAGIIGVVYNGSAKYPNAIEPHSRFILFIRVGNREHLDRVDEAMDKARAT